MKRKIFNKVTSLVLCLALILSSLPIFTNMAYAADGTPFDKVVDANTMNGWTKYFDLEFLSTENAGGVWTDKTVLANADVFAGTGITMLDDEKNFLTVLSTIAAGKEIVGYSTLPTDTVLVLDVSGSMSGDAGDLIKAANNAIAKLLETNNNNRVGVVLYSASGSTGSSSYSQSVTRLLPIGRYTTTNDQYLRISGGTVSISNSVRIEGQSDDPHLDNTKSVNGGTYIQSGLWEAMLMFEEMDTVIGENNWQTGEERMPILVLMSDGAPTTGTSYYDDVANSKYSYTTTTNSRPGRPGTTTQVTVNGSNVGNGAEANMTEGQGFLVQLTASYVINRIENHYKGQNVAAKSLFYTLGFNVSGNSIATSVLNPDSSTATDSLWSTYNSLTGDATMMVNVKNPAGNNVDVAISRNSYATDKSYVDEYFSADAQDGLTAAFEDIVEEILLQSRYFPTHLEGGNPDFSGYVEFTDILGQYMEIKHINGILLGDVLFDGHMMASKIADTSEGGLGTVNSPTALGNEFIRAVKTRLGIVETAEAQALVAKAFAAGQLKYNSATDWSNYIGWYAKADGTFLAFWDDNSQEKAPEGAVYQIRSYGFLGETTGSIKNSDMMYMSVQVSTDIATGVQTVSWKIPASLVPMITYLVSLDGDSVDAATDVTLSVDDIDNVAPIRLVYETGLRSDLNEFNITTITDSQHIAEDGHTRLFWNNYFDVSAPSHDQHVTTIAEFTPNLENERFYFTFDSAVHKKVGDLYVMVGENETLDEDGEYYHRRYIFQQGKETPLFFYEKMSPASIKAAKDNGWQEDFETLDHQRVGAWVVPAGTPARELQMYDEQKGANLTNSAKMVFHPYISESNNIVYVDMNLGNNGQLAVSPATGIKVSKTVDFFEAGTNGTFEFRITAALNGTYDAWITDIGATPEGEPTAITFTDGVYEFELSRDKTLWISGIPAGTAYVVEEISDNDDYKVKSAHVNGVATGTVATGTVAQFRVDDVHFVNTVMGEGDLVITKRVEDAEGNVVDIPDSVKFTMEVTLADARGNPVSGTFSTTAGSITVPATGKFTITLAEGESFIIRGVQEETEFTVVETDIPTGFEFDEDSSVMTGTVVIEGNRALVVNIYSPVGVSGTDVLVTVSKEIAGNRTEWLDGEAYTFVLERLNSQRTAGTVIGTKTIKATDQNKETLFDLSTETYDHAGSYYYRITEQSGTQGGVTYDTAERRFVVVVADQDKDGQLEIVAVNNELNTVVTGQWDVSAEFTNTYAPSGQTSVTININKEMVGAHGLSGYQFALYNANPLTEDADEILRSGLTDAAGKAHITLTYAANRATMAGTTYTYYLAEINAGEKINNIQYSDAVYKIEVTVKDNGDGTISATMQISGLPGTETEPVFVNEYVPSSSDYVVISGRKTTTGNRVLNANEFQFLLQAVTEGAPLPQSTVASNSANGFFSFGAIEFGDQHKGNTYKYTVTESKDNPIGGFTYDDTVYEITVTVTDNGETITATVTMAGPNETVENLVFHNPYDPTDVEVELGGTKILTGKEMQEDEFSFQIEAITENAPMPLNTIVKNAANGHIDFGKITYDRAGIYEYTVVELAGQDTRYDYDESVYKVTVIVRDNSRGVLTAEITLTKDDMPSQEIVFRNGFVPTEITYDVSTDFEISKELAGRPLGAGEFQFTLVNALTGQQIGGVVANEADGTISLPVITLPEVGDYHFDINEVEGNKAGVTYDTAEYHLLLTVAQTAEGDLYVKTKTLYKSTISKVEVGGVLTEVTNFENVTEGGKIQFTNVYKAEATEYQIIGTKVLEGRDLAEEEFSFQLLDEAGDEVETVTNLADGSIVFTAIPVDEEGEYIYTVIEVAGEDDSITYDETEYTVVVIVTDLLDGTFKVEYEYQADDADAEAVVFTNVYKAEATDILITAEKELDGRDLVEGEFSFQLQDAEGEEIETVTNGADGSVVFAGISVDEAGEYVYTIVELAGEDDTITYDGTVYTVVVTVTDLLDGTFKVEYQYQAGEAEAEAAVFTNYYTAPEVTTPGQTGSGNDIWLWIMAMMASGATLAVFGARTKRRSYR